MHREHLGGNTPLVYLACEKVSDGEGRDCTAIWTAVSESRAGAIESLIGKL